MGVVTSIAAMSKRTSNQLFDNKNKKIAHGVALWLKKQRKNNQYDLIFLSKSI